MWRRLAAGVAALALVAGAAWFLPHPFTPRPAVQTRNPVAATVAAVAATPTPTAAVAAGVPHAAADPHEVMRSGSLRGSAPDGRLSFTADGRLFGDRELRRLFDYYLSAIGELDVTAIRSLLADTLRRDYDPVQVDQVVQQFDRYRDYQLALAALPPDADLQRRLTNLHALRQRYLGDAMAAAFFADEEHYADYTLALQQLDADGSLDATQRASARRELEAQLPDELRQQRALAQTSTAVSTQQEQFAADNVEPAQRHAERAAAWGEDAAQRLDALDADRDDWQSRLSTYAQWRDAIEADRSLDAGQRAVALQSLLNRSFHDREQVRVLALQQEGLLPKPGG